MEKDERERKKKDRRKKSKRKKDQTGKKERKGGKRRKKKKERKTATKNSFFDPPANDFVREQNPLHLWISDMIAAFVFHNLKQMKEI